MDQGIQSVADALVVVFTSGMSLAEWRRLGLLEREWALYERIGPAYRTIVLVTFGDGEDQRIGAELGRHVRVVCNTDGSEPARFEARVPALVGESLAGASEAIVKTNQMEGGALAVAIARDLRRRGIRAGLIARGGYPWSRFEAALHGPGSVRAADAGEQERELCAAADVVVGTSQAMVGDLSWRYGIAAERTRLVPNYVLEDVPSRGAAERDEATVLYAGQLVARKRVHLIVEALGLVKDITRHSPRLWIIGEGPERPRLEARASELGIDTTIEARLPHRELLERMSRCTVYAQASSLEGHPKAVIEAMATGAPVVVTDAPGLATVVDHASTGLVFPAEASALARGIAGLLEDPHWAEAIGEAASARTRSRYGLARVASLELEAHAAAMEVAGSTAPAAPAPVRWDPSLLDSPVEKAVGAWERSLRGFARRLDASRAGAFLMSLDGAVYQLQGEMAVRAGDGLHPKHTVTRYHEFFTDRVEPGWRVADLGCGGGALACALAEAGATVVGMDVSEDHARQARARAAREGLNGAVRVRVGDITADRLEGQFDAVVLSNVLEHLAQRPSLLRRWIEWYRPRRVLVRVPAFDRDWRVAWKRELGVEWRLDPTHETEYVRDQLESELREGGLVVEELIGTWGEYWAACRPA